jgi:hypothetical protein
MGHPHLDVGHPAWKRRVVPPVAGRFQGTIETKVHEVSLSVNEGSWIPLIQCFKEFELPHVTVNYEMFLPGGHHRQPRNASIDLNLAPTAGGDVPNPGTYTPPFFAELPYTLNGGDGLAQMLFWSVTDDSQGQVLPPAPFDQTVGTSPLTITAWYYPVSGPGVGGDGSLILDDAFSANLGRFIDDTFVDVTSDPTRTNDANVSGFVLTNVAETLVAKSSVATTTEPFSRWIFNDGLKPVNNTTLQVAKGSGGIAIAIYQQPSQARRPSLNPNQYAIWQWVDYGTMVDGGPHPWNPYVNQLMGGVALGAAAPGFDKKVQGELVRVAVEQVKFAAAAIAKSIQSSIE